MYHSVKYTFITLADFSVKCSTTLEDQYNKSKGVSMNNSLEQLQSNKTLTLVLYILYIAAIFSAGLLAIVASSLIT